MMEYGEKALHKRIRTGAITRQDVTRALAELAFGQANDCVRLVLEDSPAVENLDLRLLSEVRRNEKGTVEIRLVDRLRVLEQLAALAGQDESGLKTFLQAMQETA